MQVVASWGTCQKLAKQNYTRTKLALMTPAERPCHQQLSLLLNVLSQQHIHEHILPQRSAVYQNMDHPGPVHGAMGPWGHAHCSTAFYRKAGLQFGRSYSGNKTIFMQSNRSSSGSLGRLASCPEDGQNPPAPTGALPRQCYVEVTTSILEKTIANLI